MVRKFHFLIVTICLLLLVQSNSYAQTKVVKKHFKSGKKHLKKQRFNNAKADFKIMLEAGAFKQEELFFAGVAFYRSRINAEKSLPLFHKALASVPEKKDTIDELLLYTGLAHHFMDEFEPAIEFYNLYKKRLKSNKRGRMLGAEVDLYIEMCNNGAEIIASKDTTVVFKKFPNTINSEYKEYVPIISLGEDMLIFCSRRPMDGEEPIGPDDNMYFENIYYSQKDGDGNWSNAKLISKSAQYLNDEMNSKRHEAPVSLSPDGKTLFIYADNELYKSENVNGTWQLPQKMNANVNIGAFNPSAFISRDGQTLYITSEAEGGIGGRDLYVSKMVNGDWSIPKNVGTNINTPNDEDAPYLSKDGKYLYFSSNGHNSMGGYDIFRSEILEDGSLGEPMNIGSPYNSSGDDIYYVENENGTIAYFASFRPGSTGDLDVYSASIECETIPMAEVKGFAILARTGRPLSGTIHVTNKNTGEDYGIFPIDKMTGRYAMSLPPNQTYYLEMEVDGYKRERPHREEFFIPKQCTYYNLFQQVSLDLLRDGNGVPIAQRAHFRNAMFDIEKEVKEQYQKDEIANFEQKAPKTDYTIHGSLAFDKLLKADKVGVQLLNEQKEIVRSTKTNDQGFFAFDNVEKSKNYSLLISEFDAKVAKNGLANSSLGSELKLEGFVQTKGVSDSTHSNLKEVIFVDQDGKATAYIDLTSSEFILKDKVESDDKLQALNASGFTQNLETNNPDLIYTAYLKTIDPNNTELAYTEVIDIIDIKHGSDIPVEFTNILFDFDKSILRDTSKRILEKLATFMKSNPQVHVKLDGYTDFIGTEEYNEGLSKRRSESAFGYLVNNGINENRLTSKWFGESNPVAPNENQNGTDNPEGRQLNRRVEIHLNSPELGQVVLSYSQN